MKRIASLLRSPRLALGLLVYLVAYSALTTLIPQRGVATDADLAAWRETWPLWSALATGVGLDQAYWSPLFVLPALALIVSTALCSWSRASQGRALWGLRRGVADDLARRVVARPRHTVVPSEGVSARKRLTAALGEHGLAIQDRDAVVTASARLWAAWGSAAFHWSLVALFLVALVGQAVKWEGVIGVPVGHALADTAADYGVLVRGPLAPASPSSGYSIAVAEMDTDLVADGIERGHAPLVRLLRGDRVVAERRVYPNSPLSHDGLFIHRGEEWGLAVVAALETSAGVELGRRNYLFDFLPTGGTGRLTIEDAMPPESGVERLRYAVVLDPGSEGFIADLAQDPRVEVTPLGSVDSTTTLMRPGDTVTFPDASATLRIVDVTRYVRLFVVHDPTIWLVYAAFALAMAAGAFALLVQPRAVVAVARRREDGTEVLDVAVLAKRMDPLFRYQMDQAIAPLTVVEESS